MAFKTVLQQNCSCSVPMSEFVKLFVNVEGNHWITISNIGEKANCVNLYDSLYNDVSAFIHPRKHLGHYLPTRSLPTFPSVLAEHFPVVLHKEVHIQLKPVEKSLSDYDEDILYP